MKSTEFQFRPDEDLSTALVRLTGLQRLEAEKWAVETKRPDEAVHQVRLALKLLRALLKLSCRATGARFHQRENARMRKAAKALSAWRDETVIRNTLKKALGKTQKKYRPFLAQILAGSLKSSPAAAQMPPQENMLHAVACIRALEEQLASQPLKSKPWRGIEDGLVKSYRQVRHSLKHIQTSDTDESFHERRKQTKYLLFQIAMLEPVWPARLARLHRKLKKLQDLLGKDHDLVIAREWLQTIKTGHPDLRDKLVTALLRQNRALRLDIQRQADLCFGGYAGSFVKKFIRHFHQWRRLEPAPIFMPSSPPVPTSAGTGPRSKA